MSANAEVAVSVAQYNVQHRRMSGPLTVGALLDELQRLRKVEEAAADGAAAGEALYAALRRFAYAWETDTPDKAMWVEWQRAKDAMTTYRSATAVPDDGQPPDVIP